MQQDPSRRAIIMIEATDTWQAFCVRVAQKLQLKAQPHALQLFLQGFPISSIGELSHDDRLDVVD